MMFLLFSLKNRCSDMKPNEIKLIVGLEHYNRFETPENDWSVILPDAVFNMACTAVDVFSQNIEDEEIDEIFLNRIFKQIERNLDDLSMPEDFKEACLEVAFGHEFYLMLNTFFNEFKRNLFSTVGNVGFVAERDRQSTKRNSLLVKITLLPTNEQTTRHTHYRNPSVIANIEDFSIQQRR